MKWIITQNCKFVKSQEFFVNIITLNTMARKKRLSDQIVIAIKFCWLLFYEKLFKDCVKI